MITRCLLALSLALACASPVLATTSDGSAPAIEVWKSATCECCGNWVKHLEANGFVVQG